MTSLQAEFDELEHAVRGGEIDVDRKSVIIREDEKRKIDQNRVMHGSAIDAYKNFFNTYKTKLSTEVQDVFKKAENARGKWQGGSYTSQWRPEWCHAIAYSLAHKVDTKTINRQLIPIIENPQVKLNLAAAPKYLNTQMMELERAAKWHAKNRANCKIHVDSKFNIIPGTDLLRQGILKISFCENNNAVLLSQTLYPYQKYPAMPKATDIAQTTMVTHNILMNTPASVLSVVKAIKNPKKRSRSPEEKLTTNILGIPAKKKQRTLD